jgi:hypothetical protein
MMGPEVAVLLPSINVHKAVSGLMLMLRPGLHSHRVASPDRRIAGSPESVSSSCVFGMGQFHSIV